MVTFGLKEGLTEGLEVVDTDGFADGLKVVTFGLKEGLEEGLPVVTF